jgi:hypothetical protein
MIQQPMVLSPRLSHKRIQLLPLKLENNKMGTAAQVA